MATTFVKIASVTVGSGGAVDITFSSIPGTYTDLKLVLSSRAATGGASDIFTVFNNDTSSTYSWRQLQGSGSAASSNGGTQVGYIFTGTTNGSSDTASVFASNEFYIPNYTASNNKSFFTDSVTENNATTAYQTMRASLWPSNSAITSIKLTNGTGANFAQYTTATLYGIKSS